MAEGGVGTVRVLLPWNVVDPTPAPDDFDFSSIDPVIASAARSGVEPLLFIFGIPQWAMALDGCEDGCGGVPAPSSEETITAWGDLAAAASERYGPGGELWREYPELPENPVRKWQIWNEQNSGAFFAPEPDIELFARMLTAAESEISRRDRGATVILGGLQPVPLGGKRLAVPAPEFLQRLYAIDGIEDRFDGVAIHPYAAKAANVAAAVEAVHAAIGRAGDDASVWVTEIGWSSGAGESHLERGPEGQAGLLSESFDLLLERRLEWDLRSVVWFSWRDRATDPVCDWCAYSGLFAESALEPKPAWEALTALTGGE